MHRLLVFYVSCYIGVKGDAGDPGVRGDPGDRGPRGFVGEIRQCSFNKIINITMNFHSLTTQVKLSFISLVYYRFLNISVNRL